MNKNVLQPPTGFGTPCHFSWRYTAKWVTSELSCHRATSSDIQADIFLDFQWCARTWAQTERKVFLFIVTAVGEQSLFVFVWMLYIKK